MFGRGGFDFFDMLFSSMAAAEKEREREKWGITNINGYDGVTKVGIPHIYEKISITNQMFYCKKEGLTTVYDYAGNKLFTSRDILSLGHDRYLVEIIDEEIVKEDWGYALFKNGIKLTDDIFKPKGRFNEKFNEQGYYIVELCDTEKTLAIINRDGDIVYEYEPKYWHSHYTTLYGVILKTDKGYLSLLTKTYICGEPYRSGDVMDNNECLFVKTEENCIYQISMNNGEFIIHGKPKEKEKPKTDEEVKAEEERRENRNKIEEKYNQEAVTWSKLNRNDKCLCGSGKKFKHCCIKTYKDDLRANMRQELEQKGLNG